MTTEADSVSELAMAAFVERPKPFLIEAPEGRTFIARPKVSMTGHGMDTEWLAEQITSANKAEVLMPKHVTQGVTLQDAHSLVEYLNRFKNFDTVLFADIDTNTILGVLDYHKMPEANRPDVPADTGVDKYDASARLTKHTARLQVPFSLEWKTWTGIDGKLMRHVDFASFLEENASDILALPPARDAGGNQVEDAPTTLLELCRELQVKSSYGATSAVRSGDYTNVEFQKGDDISTKKNVALPLSINLQIPVYFGEQAVPVTAFMRRRVDDSQLLLGIKLMRPENVRQDEFHRIVGHVATNVELTTLYGKPA